MTDDQLLESIRAVIAQAFATSTTKWNLDERFQAALRAAYKPFDEKMTEMVKGQLQIIFNDPRFAADVGDSIRSALVKKLTDQALNSIDPDGSGPQFD